ncbi:MAG TPA: carboxypeptidase M32, partial [Pirellulales bacterium]|nr:carboxypeptidase M32 [Pirellulales bacterium]
VHDRFVDPRIEDWLSALEASPLAADPLSDTGATIRQLRRQYDKKTKLPKRLVEELARTAVLGQQVWQEARANNDFAAFAPLLDRTLTLKREQAEALGYDDNPYDALLDEFEQGERAADVARVLAALRAELVPLVAAIAESRRRPDVSLLARNYPVDRQQAFGHDAAARIGFDFNRGRLDVTAHPFCSGMGPNDCRITTRYQPQFFNSGFFGILHEAGHGIYEQGLRTDQYGLPLGEYVSLGIHESQSRLWENLVGRSRAFWEHFLPEARRRYPEALSDVGLDAFFFAINDVRPSLVRVEADEATYNLHILIRFELEQALLLGDLPIADLPAAWKEQYQRALGIEPQGDADGVLQDIHWSAGLIGYFPTYSLGNLYGAQFFEQADADLDGLAAQFSRGEFEPLKKWLAENIHQHGQRYTAAELIERVTGKPLSHEPLMRHLRGKLGPLYGL